ncbi:hypothetical protein NW762_014806 [Fusarium torreyae]|uniref:Heterokaryon incompatibility domain-containing protein n=1 Tax=Fusarium torreyae TaxID=1237075 RepID=A0A9W8RLI6_9HYPO|nr:hypothetical protein NW762_014806 [Fusarium torreyae]
MQPPQTGTCDTPPDDAIIVAAGEWLVSLCSKSDINTKDQLLSPLERQKFDEFFTLHRRSPIFKKYHIEAIRKCLTKDVKPNNRLAREFLEKDDTQRLFVGENDILQATIKTARKEPEFLGRSFKISCPELAEMVELLMSHGASANSLDDDGNSPLFYACVLGYEELFRLLISAGADISTTHRRQLPYQLKKSDDDSKEPIEGKQQETAVNLLQVTLDALISPQRITDMTLVGWPPGVHYDHPLWEGDPKSTWGGIILYLLEKGLSYAKEDPGLIMLLHIVCYQGQLDLVEQLLSFGIATDVAGLRVVNGGHGKGNSLGTAMHAASFGQRISVVSILMAHGVSPRSRRQCFLNRAGTEGELTPIEVAIATCRYVDKEKLLVFLYEFIQQAEELEDPDYQAALEYSVKRDNFDFTKRLLERGVRLSKVPSNTESVAMAQLLISHDIALNPAKLQKKALARDRFDLLRWCVSEYGPLLPSDPKSWGEMASWLLDKGYRYIENVRYLVTEYPGPHIDTVLIANLTLYPKEEEPTPTSWLHLAILKNIVTAMEIFLEAGADPSLPGLPTDAPTAIRNSGYNQFDLFPWRFELVKTLEKRRLDDEQWTLPSYEEVRSRMADEVAIQNCQWNKRLEKLAERRQNVPHIEAHQEPSSTKSFRLEISTQTATYPPLNGTSAFRLLELQPSDSQSEPLVGQLVDSDITFRPDYEALSYVWGDITTVRYIRLDEQEVSITPNLHSALTHLRSASEVRTLWVDALCINQSTHGERNQQVRIMGDIYKSARQVVVWLGDAADDSHLVFDFLNDDTELGGFINRPDPPEPKHLAWMALVRRPWFYRTWVIQELALARRAIMMCGKDSTIWINEDQTWGDPDFAGGAKGLSTVFSDPGNQPDHPLSGFNADSHIWRLRSLEAGSDPMSILRYSRVCQTTEIKDKIYGIVGLFEPGFIEVDYDLPVEDIFQQFTEAVIRLTGDLRIFKYLGATRHLDGVSSWVPDFTDTTTRGLPEQDWSPPYRSDNLEEYTLRFADGSTSSIPRGDLAKKSLPGWEFLDGGGILIKGKMTDTIRVLGPELPDGMDYAPGTDNFARIMREWETLAATLIPDWKDSVGPSVTGAFATTLASSSGRKVNSIEFGFTEWYRHCGTGILEAKDPSMFLRDHEFYLWWLGVGKDHNDEDFGKVTFELREYAEQMEYASYGRCLFTTEGGSMGLASTRARTGDCIVYFPGASEPFVLRRRKDGKGWTMVNDCYLYGLDLDDLFYDNDHLVEDFVIY